MSVEDDLKAVRQQTAQARQVRAAKLEERQKQRIVRYDGSDVTRGGAVLSVAGGGTIPVTGGYNTNGNFTRGKRVRHSDLSDPRRAQIDEVPIVRREVPKPPPPVEQKSTFAVLYYLDQPSNRGVWVADGVNKPVKLPIEAIDLPLVWGGEGVSINSSTFRPINISIVSGFTEVSASVDSATDDAETAIRLEGLKDYFFSVGEGKVSRGSIVLAAPAFIVPRLTASGSPRRRPVEQPTRSTAWIARLYTSRSIAVDSDYRLASRFRNSDGTFRDITLQELETFVAVDMPYRSEIGWFKPGKLSANFRVGAGAPVVFTGGGYLGYTIPFSSQATASAKIQAYPAYLQHTEKGVFIGSGTLDTFKIWEYKAGKIKLVYSVEKPDEVQPPPGLASPFANYLLADPPIQPKKTSELLDLERTKPYQTLSTFPSTSNTNPYPLTTPRVSSTYIRYDNPGLTPPDISNPYFLVDEKVYKKLYPSVNLSSVIESGSIEQFTDLMIDGGWAEFWLVPEGVTLITDAVKTKRVKLKRLLPNDADIPVRKPGKKQWFSSTDEQKRMLYYGKVAVASFGITPVMEEP